MTGPFSVLRKLTSAYSDQQVLDALQKFDEFCADDVLDCHKLQRCLQHGQLTQLETSIGQALYKVTRRNADSAISLMEALRRNRAWFLDPSLQACDTEGWHYGQKYQGPIKKWAGFPSVVGRLLSDTTAGDDGEETHFQQKLDYVQSVRYSQDLEDRLNSSKFFPDSDLETRALALLKLGNMKNFSDRWHRQQLKPAARECPPFQSCKDVPEEIQTYFAPANAVLREGGATQMFIAHRMSILNFASDPMLWAAVVAYQGSYYTKINQCAHLISQHKDHSVVGLHPESGAMKLKMNALCSETPMPRVGKESVLGRWQTGRQSSTNKSFSSYYDLIRKLTNSCLSTSDDVPHIQGEVAFFRGLKFEGDPLLSAKPGASIAMNILESSSIKHSVAHGFADSNVPDPGTNDKRSLKTIAVIYVPKGVEVPAIVPGNANEGYAGECEAIFAPGQEVRRIGTCVCGGSFGSFGIATRYIFFRVEVGSKPQSAPGPTLLEQVLGHLPVSKPQSALGPETSQDSLSKSELQRLSVIVSSGVQKAKIPHVTRGSQLSTEGTFKFQLGSSTGQWLCWVKGTARPGQDAELTMQPKNYFEDASQYQSHKLIVKLNCLEGKNFEIQTASTPVASNASQDKLEPLWHHGNNMWAGSELEVIRALANTLTQ